MYVLLAFVLLLQELSCELLPAMMPVGYVHLLG